ncbi:MAG TPA: helix-turn-helix domain-containing protein [Pyrinomonadaceae bacterium]|jgi:excisionase family DNA binding protein
MEYQELIAAKEAAKHLGISRASLCRLVKKNRIGVYRIGNRTMFDKEVLDTFKKSVYVEPNFRDLEKEKKENE